ncbi:uridylate kinase, putative [Aciduliprofundum boonei T469]|nr:uridylate kinase, putative [Aciduliprofundum boonei T469]
MAVISLGGSIVCGDNIDFNYIFSFRKFLEEQSKNDKIFLVVGGGKIARDYISMASKLGMNEFLQDRIGIMASRINASLFLGNYSYPKVADSVEEAVIASGSYPVVLMGGTEPGHTTDAVSLLIAERIGERRVINMTSVGGVYDKDPRKYKDAKIIRRMSYREAQEMFLSRDMDAGLNLPFDLVSIKIAERSKIEICIMGKSIEDLKKAMLNGECKGTIIGITND